MNSALPAAKPLGRRIVLWLSLLFVSGALACGHAQSDGEDIPEKYELSFNINKNVYRPGEALLATVTLRNNSDEPIQVRALDAKSISFFFGRFNDAERMSREPVSSRTERLDKLVEIHPGQEITRQFLATRLTQYTGQLSVQIHYDPSVGLGAQTIPKLYSNTLRYDVTGESFVARDAAGLIMKDEAIKLAIAAAGEQAIASEAILIEDEAGFYKWWVNLAFGEVASPTIKSWFVDPYKASVWKQAKPFNPQLAEDKRFQRPANLPKAAPPDLSKIDPKRLD